MHSQETATSVLAVVRTIQKNWYKSYDEYLLSSNKYNKNTWKKQPF